MSEMNEYSALHNGALFFDRSDRMRMRISGPKAAELVTGMVTNDVSALTPGEGQYAAALTPKGKIVADLRIFALDDALLIDTAAAASPGWKEMVRKYVNPRLAPYHDVSSELADIGVFGRSARLVISRVAGVDDRDLAELDPYSHITRTFGSGSIIIARVPEIDIEGYEIFAPMADVPDLKSKLRSAGAAEGAPETWEIARVESGRPMWGVDMDDSTLPQEANFDELGAISYTKGCYIGQETVARVHFRGHVNRFLRRLRFVTRPAPPRGAELIDETGKVIGDVRSSALSPRYGGVALGMVRREVLAGTTLQAKWDGGECSVQIEQNEKGATV
ncbi:MAG TPA: glycine cleavage T C-terminal barrel domain-containing protein [Gemmatimonadaceae bacterium]|jgi:folate-binding protein YgfZ|nr:glycine cleavage T C-terminal barrel domain-containing protein [Gemmatimonadaceae bacterium]